MRSLSAAPSAATLPPERCRVYMLSVAEATGLRLHPAHLPCRWGEHQYSSEAWMDRWLRHSSLLTSDPESADVIFLSEHSFSLWCHRQQAVAIDKLRSHDVHVRANEGRACHDNDRDARAGATVAVERAVHAPLPEEGPLAVRSSRVLGCDSTSKQRVWLRMLRHPLLNSSASARPKVLVLTNTECSSAPWRNAQTDLPDELIVLGAQNRGVRAADIAIPLAVSSPAWLVGDAPPPAGLPPWGDRKLLFFAGHVPKLYISPTRYKLWRALRRSPHVTAVSSSIDCTVGAYEVCASRARIEAEYATFCRRPSCRPERVYDQAKPRACAPSAEALRVRCRAYAGVDWPSESPDINRSSAVLPRADFLARASRHRFFLVAVSGDLLFTPKITEALALGAAAGTLPVFVMPEGLFRRPHRVLPYTRWLDYCAVGVFVSDSLAIRRPQLLLERLQAMGALESERRRAALRAAWSALVFRRRSDAASAEGSSGEPTSASDYILGEACAFARAQRQRGTGARGSAADVYARSAKTSASTLSACRLRA